MPEAFWFKPKSFGYGATPTTWQGWALCGAYLVVLAASTIMLLPFRGGGFEGGRFTAWIAVVLVATAALWIVSKRKTDGEWRWRSGSDAT